MDPCLPFFTPNRLASRMSSGLFPLGQDPNDTSASRSSDCPASRVLSVCSAHSGTSATSVDLEPTDFVLPSEGDLRRSLRGLDRVVRSVYSMVIDELVRSPSFASLREDSGLKRLAGFDDDESRSACGLGQTECREFVADDEVISDEPLETLRTPATHSLVPSSSGGSIFAALQAQEGVQPTSLDRAQSVVTSPSDQFIFDVLLKKRTSTRASVRPVVDEEAARRLSVHRLSASHIVSAPLTFTPGDLLFARPSSPSRSTYVPRSGRQRRSATERWDKSPFSAVMSCPPPAPRSTSDGSPARRRSTVDDAAWWKATPSLVPKTPATTHSSPLVPDAPNYRRRRATTSAAYGPPRVQPTPRSLSSRTVIPVGFACSRPITPSQLGASTESRSGGTSSSGSRSTVATPPPVSILGSVADGKFDEELVVLGEKDVGAGGLPLPESLNIKDETMGLILTETPKDVATLTSTSTWMLSRRLKHRQILLIVLLILVGLLIAAVGGSIAAVLNHKV